MPAGGEMVTLQVPLLVLTVEPHAVQPADSATLLFCCNEQAAVLGQEIMTVLPEWEMGSQGSPAVCTTEMRLQKPPVTE